MNIITLDRFELTGALGSGADYDVRAATDRETGQPVALKRPSPQAARRQMHGPIEERTDRILAAYEAAGQYCAAVPRLIGITNAAIHDAYFGDDVGQPYRVRVEERAPGIPLVGDPRSRILRVPIGLGQNLFALHPLAAPAAANADARSDAGHWPVQEQLLAAQEVFANAGYALLDLGPHNVFYSPGAGRIALIDAGALVGHGADRLPGNRGYQDVHDFYVEMLKFYLTPELPPQDAAGYYAPYNQRPVISLEQECADLARAFDPAEGGGSGSADLDAAATACIAKVRRREYAAVAHFGQDFQQCLRLIAIRNDSHPDRETALAARQQALARLREPHWTRYLFDAATELGAVSN